MRTQNIPTSCGTSVKTAVTWLPRLVSLILARMIDRPKSILLTVPTTLAIAWCKYPPENIRNSHWWYQSNQCFRIPMLHKTSSRSAQAWSVLNGITQLPATHTFYTRKGRATPGNIHPQSSTAVTHCLLIATHFTDPRKDDIACVKLESATESWTRAVGVRGEWVTTHPPAPLITSHWLPLHVLEKTSATSSVKAYRFITCALRVRFLFGLTYSLSVFPLQRQFLVNIRWKLLRDSEVVCYETNRWWRTRWRSTERRAEPTLHRHRTGESSSYGGCLGHLCIFMIITSYGV